MTFRRWLVLVAVTLTASVGDTFLAVGMHKIGPISVHHPLSLIAALKVPWVVAGILLLIGFFASYLTALSWADLTFVLPATSLGYVVVALLAKFWLHEYISPWRWSGIAFIALAVSFIARGPSLTQHEPQLETTAS
jgi:drug/metabolite transporter (DMT)-like permease